MIDFLVRYFDIWYPAVLVGSIALFLLALLIIAICDRSGWRNIPEAEVCCPCSGHCAGPREINDG